MSPGEAPLLSLSPPLWRSFSRLTWAVLEVPQLATELVEFPVHMPCLDHLLLKVCLPPPNWRVPLCAAQHATFHVVVSFSARSSTHGLLMSSLALTQCFAGYTRHGLTILNGLSGRNCCDTWATLPYKLTTTSQHDFNSQNKNEKLPSVSTGPTPAYYHSC